MASRPVIQAPPEAVARLRELQERKQAYEGKRLASLDVFAQIGYVPHDRQQVFHDATEDDVLYGGAAGGGKGGRCPDRASSSYNMSMETRVLTPKGFKLIGDVEIGDQVCNPDGTVARVIRVTDNGPKHFYRVTLADGSSVEADEDHLWAVSIAGTRKARKNDVPVIPGNLRPQDEWNLRVQTRCRIVTTVELRELALRAAGEKARGLRPHYVQIPLANPLKMTGVQTQWPVFSPYVLGALVGDGSLREDTVSITGIDEPVFDRIRAELPTGLQLTGGGRPGHCPVYRITQTETKDLLAPFKAELKRWRSERGLGQRGLAEIAGTTQAQISAIERGFVWPRRRTVEALDEGLGAGGALLASYRERQSEHPAVLLKRDGLAGTHAWDKFIPGRIKNGTAEDRFAFIQGLFDTDGHMDERGHVEFVTVSQRLALDAQEVLRSLGYRATLTTKTPAYTYNGEKRQGRLAHRLYVQGRDMDRLFHIPRKRERVARFNGGDIEPWHRVVSVEPSGTDNSRCIQVDNLNHLYVTDDYIVTHNSAALVAEGLRACARYPGIRVLLLRRSYDELEESIFPNLRKFGMAKAIGGRWNGVKHQLTFTNGSLFRFRYLERVEDAARRQGGEYQLLLVDELTLMAPGIVDFLRYERIRSGSPGVPVLGVRATSNPGGVGHGEVRARYIEATGYGQRTATDDHGLTVRFIPAKATDNPHLDAGYQARLDAIPDPARRAAMRDGDWDQFAGMMFPEFSDARHMLGPVALPASWRRYNGVDWGFAAPWAVLWAAVDEDRRAWVYRELYATQVGEADQARRILEAEAGEEVIARWADDAMWATRGDAKPIAEVYAENGVHLTKAGKGPGSRVQGWQRWHSYMEEMPACAHHRALGWETCPRVHIFTTCPNLRSELKALPHATTGDPEDADPKAADHAADAGRYLLLNIDGGATFYDSPEPLARGPGELLTAMGSWAVREDPAERAARAAKDPERKQGATQTWDEVLASMNR